MKRATYSNSETFDSGMTYKDVFSYEVIWYVLNIQNNLHI